MAKEIITILDPLLKQKSGEVETFDNNLEDLVKDMLETMKHHQGVGLAAVQIGTPLRVLTYLGYDGKAGFMVNPVIVQRSEKIIDSEEGCLSVLGDSDAGIVTMPRHEWIKVKFRDLKGDESEMLAEKRNSVVIQHEIDHLDGICITDSLSPLKRDMIRRRISKLERYKIE
ncbi:MAG: peptide deformylase [Alphaproteobacteria bacterium]|nr:peptide deformylase [Alphaproteobacteria bacterium]